MTGRFDGQALFALALDPVAQGVADRAGVRWLALDALAGLHGREQLVIAAWAQAALLWRRIVGHLQVFDVDGGAAHALGVRLGGVEGVVCFGWHGLCQFSGISLALALVVASWAMVWSVQLS